jgi:TonB-linked SusC/RagA family outer membrane protein
VCVFAQQKTIRGKITDPQGNPVSGVNVTIKGSNKGASTDANGIYSIPATAEDILVFSYVGYAGKEIKVGAQESINVSMSAADNTGDEVIVIGYGAKKRANLVGSVATVNIKEIEDLPVANLSTALRNTVPGVSISQASGKPGAATTLNIRNAQAWGTNISSTDPLFVIDGVTYDGQTNQQSNGKTAFDLLDPTQIESITFLKDAAASIYGARGANGVVLVTTKRGKIGKPSINYSGSYGISSAVKMPSMLTGYEHLTLLNNKYNGRIMANSLVNKNNLYTDDELNYVAENDNDWAKQTWTDAHLQRHTVGVSGGTEKLTYFAGANYYNETGNLGDLFDKKYGFRFGTNAKILDNLTANISISIDNSNLNRPSPKSTPVSENSESLSTAMSALLITPRWVPMYINDLPMYSSLVQWHPRALINSGTYSKSLTNGMNVTASLEYKVKQVEGLSFKMNYGFNRRTGGGKEYYVKYPLYQFATATSNHTGAGVSTVPVIYTEQYTLTYPRGNNGDFIYIVNANSQSYQLNESVTYARRFGKHDINFLLLAEQAEGGDNRTVTQANTQVIPGIDELWAYSFDKNNYDHIGTSQEFGRASYLGRLDYTFNNRYLFEAVLRADASPNFPPKSRWGYFPSLGVGWKISEEAFFQKNVAFVNDLKFRVQVGLTGNDNVANYQYYNRYTQESNGGYLFGTTFTNGINNGAIPNPRITWEKALFQNYGVDGTFFNRKFNFAIDVYSKYETDKLEPATATVPTTFGAAISDQNHGKLRSWGIEASLGYNGSIGKDFDWFVNANFGKSNNKVIDKYTSAADTGYKYPIGRSTDGGIEGYQSAGIVRTQEDVKAWYDKHPGWLIGSDSLRVGGMNFVDRDGDGKITEADKTLLYRRANPLFGIGFNIGCSWKGLKFSTNISLIAGGKKTYEKAARTSVTESANALSFWKDSWSPDNPNAKYPVAGSAYINEVYDTWIVDATAMYINNMQLSYQVPKTLTSKWKVPSLRVYVVGTNLWNIINPFPYKDSRSSQAIDYPTLKTITFGANVGL